MQRGDVCGLMTQPQPPPRPAPPPRSCTTLTSCRTLFVLSGWLGGMGREACALCPMTTRRTWTIHTVSRPPHGHHLTSPHSPRLAPPHPFPPPAPRQGKGDYKTCDNWGNRSLTKGAGLYDASVRAFEQCGDTCDEDETWIVPCVWSTIAHLDEYCSAKGYPTASNDTNLPVSWGLRYTDGQRVAPGAKQSVVVAS